MDILIILCIDFLVRLLLKDLPDHTNTQLHTVSCYTKNNIKRSHVLWFVLISNNYSITLSNMSPSKVYPHQPFLLSSYQTFLKQQRQVSLSISMHHFIWQKNVDFTKPKELICRFLVSKVGVGCLGFFGAGSI